MFEDLVYRTDEENIKSFSHNMYRSQKKKIVCYQKYK
jgi:hypothetical protein